MLNVDTLLYNSYNIKSQLQWKNKTKKTTLTCFKQDAYMRFRDVQNTNKIQLVRGYEKVIYTEFFILTELCEKQNARD